METKVCKQCLEEKPLTSEYWHKNPGTKDGYCGKCKICRSKNNVEYRKTHKHKIKMRFDAHKEHIQKYQKEYRVINQDILREKRNQYYLSNKDGTIKKYRTENAEMISMKAKKRMEEKGYNKLHHDAGHYIDKYKLRPSNCGICGHSGKIAAHHPNDKIWNEVVFCCYSCHRLIHSGKIECPEPIDLLNYQ